MQNWGCRARRTGRMEHIIHHLGLALGGRPAASFAQRLMLPVSNDTLLRVVRRRAQVPHEPVSIVGIDDFAWRRNHLYGTIVVDLERRRPVTLLPDRDTATSRAGLADHPSITVVKGHDDRRRPGSCWTCPAQRVVFRYWARASGA
jgi:transposase